MKSAIISVGTELLMGQIVDTNAVYLSTELRSLGIDVNYRYTVGDNDARLREILDLALKDVDLIITIGGLGPTEDDMTKETVCDYFGEKLVMSKKVKTDLIRHAAAHSYTLTENVYKQAMVPENGTVFYNGAGMAPGIAVEKDGKTAVMLPGPPRELKTMFNDSVRDYLKKFSGGSIYYKVIKIFGRGESSVETDLLDLIDTQTDPTIATYAKEGECTVRVASKRATVEEAEAAVMPVVNEIVRREGDHVYSIDDEELMDVVGKKLEADRISISCCESCTGGMFAEYLTTVPGISDVFERGIVTYTYRAKEEELGVDHDTLQICTAVAPEVAQQMAEGLYKKTGSDVCISVTGIAGPSGAMPGKPVGLAYIGCAYKGETTVTKVLARNLSRQWNRRYFTLAMFDIVNRKLDGRKIPESY
ncbi:MAG: competence/damage-inducible protein A [Eubacteriales bacterium]|nr:competence/damage-inducible protein A [Eubacteriales bacterium]